MRIVVCGDSFNTYDTRYPGLHWADQLEPHEVYRLARAGASNFSIYHQVLQSKKFNPDVLLISFTSCPRVEFAIAEPDFFSDILVPWVQSTGRVVWNNIINFRHVEKPTATLRELEQRFRKKMEESVDHAIPAGYKTDVFDDWARRFYIEPFEVLKNYLYIKATLDHLAQHNIRHYATLGGYKDFVGTVVQDQMIEFDQYASVLQLPNGWDHEQKLHDPYFHIEDPEYHQHHAQLVLKLL
jgi:hypothetical protein